MKAFLLLLSALAVALPGRAAETIWQVDNLGKIGGHAVTVEGAPRVTEDDGRKVIQFDGAKDGLFVPAIPFAGSRQFTLEILFFPASGGLPEQRFFHAQDGNEARALFETRLDGQGKWWLDTFIVTGAMARGVTLADREQKHPTDRWYWAALRYDGKTMAHFVNGMKELEQPGAFAAFGPGQISLGVRQNKVFWFKGMIAEVRFHTEALPEEKLQRVK